MMGSLTAPWSPETDRNPVHNVLAAGSGESHPLLPGAVFLISGASLVSAGTPLRVCRQQPSREGSDVPGWLLSSAGPRTPFLPAVFGAGCFPCCRAGTSHGERVAGLCCEVTLALKASDCSGGHV